MIAKTGKLSAGLLMCRHRPAGWEFLVVHPGGPFFMRKDAGIWSIPKGLVDAFEEPLSAAKREFQEETGFAVEAEQFLSLGHVTQKGGKVVQAWAFVGDCDPHALRSNTFTLEYPRGSGQLREFPETDRAAFFGEAEAKRKLLEAQCPFIDRALWALG
jgi:predicted NUDIX family NTP pyrophosphohydrolase